MRSGDFPSQAGFRRIMRGMDKQTTTGPNVEPATAAMVAFHQQHVRDSPVLQQVSWQTVQSMEERNVVPDAAISGWRTTVVHYFVQRALAKGVAFNYADRTHPEDWREPFDDMQEDLSAPPDQQSLAATYLLNPELRHLYNAATSSEKRYKMVDLLSKADPARFPNGARVLDVGSSSMKGILAIMHRSHLHRPSVFKSAIYTPGSKAPTIDLTKKCNELLDRPPVITSAVATDLFPVFDEEYGSFDYGLLNYSEDALRPSEHSDPIYRADLQTLVDLKQRRNPDGTLKEPFDSGVTFQQANFLDPQDLQDFKQQFPGKFDIINLIYVQQEFSRPDQLLMYYILNDLLAENGFLIYLHQAHIPRVLSQPTGPQGIEAYKSYASSPWRSQCHVQDMLHPARRGFQTMARSYDNRWDQVRFASGKLMVNGALEPFAEVIKDA